MTLQIRYKTAEQKITDDIPRNVSLIFLVLNYFKHYDSLESSRNRRHRKNRFLC